MWVKWKSKTGRFKRRKEDRERIKFNGELKQFGSCSEKIFDMNLRGKSGSESSRDGGKPDTVAAAVVQIMDRSEMPASKMSTVLGPTKYTHIDIHYC